MKENPIKEIPKLKELNNDKLIELNKTYWVSEWSWNPMCDGYSPCEEIIRYVQEIDGYKVYTTGKNYRYYFAWDIYETEEDAREMSGFKDSFGYAWDSDIANGLIDKNKIKNILGVEKKPLSFEEIDFDRVMKGERLVFKIEDYPRIVQEINNRKANIK